MLLWAGAFLSVAWLTGVQLLVFFCSSVPVVLSDTPGTSRCRSQHVSVQSSSLLHHSIYLWFIYFPWWSIGELGNLHADRTTVCLEPWQKLRARLGTRKTGLSPLVFSFFFFFLFFYWPFQGGVTVVIHIYLLSYLYIYNVYLLHDFVATLRLSALSSALYFVLSKLALWPPHFNSCSPCFP